MRQFKFLIVLSVSMVLGSSCKTSSSALSDVREELSLKSDDSMVCNANSIDTYLLCHPKADEDSPNPKRLKFVVSDTEYNIVYSNEVIGGYVKWIGDNEVEFYSPPGMPEEGKTVDHYTKIYNIKTGKVVRKSERSVSRP